jgi:hypothetical protein
VKGCILCRTVGGSINKDHIYNHFMLVDNMIDATDKKLHSATKYVSSTKYQNHDTYRVRTDISKMLHKDSIILEKAEF